MVINNLKQGINFINFVAIIIEVVYIFMFIFINNSWLVMNFENYKNFIIKDCY
jgi:hypothetical protein